MEAFHLKANRPLAKKLLVGKGGRGPQVNKFERVQGARAGGFHVTYHMGTLVL